MRRTAEDYVTNDGIWMVGRYQIGWEDTGKFYFHHRDVRWVNVWGKKLNDVRLNHEDGKIIGDE